MYLFRQRDILSGGFVFLTELQNGHAAHERTFYTVQKFFLLKARGIGYKIKCCNTRSLYVEIIVQHRLKSFSLNILIHLVKTAVIVDLKLFVALNLV